MAQRCRPPVAASASVAAAVQWRLQPVVRRQGEGGRPTLIDCLQASVSCFGV